jgi:ubiquinone/menaquinone biosynthesis C-methylase UbiE
MEKEFKTQIAAEQKRLLAELRRRERQLSPDFDANWRPAALLGDMKVRIAAVTMLCRAGVLPKAGDPCLEVGYGTRGWLGVLIDWGVRETDLHGMEVDPVSAKQAQELLPLADLRVGNATELPWDNDTFRLVIASTVFTSILDPTVRRLVAEEITRVLAPGGAMLCYDFAFNNPRNPNVRKLSKKELTRLFPRLKGPIKSVELAPPLARLVAPRSMTLAFLLERVPLLRTHFVAALVKPS